MKCPVCQHPETSVLDSRAAEDDRAIRRRRRCDKCQHRFTTHEGDLWQIKRHLFRSDIQPVVDEVMAEFREKLLGVLRKAVDG